jgi:hypothetical protein
MGWIMLVKKHLVYNPVKRANFRHFGEFDLQYKSKQYSKAKICFAIPASAYLSSKYCHLYQ